MKAKHWYDYLWVYALSLIHIFCTADEIKEMQDIVAKA